jgi:mersacidin/lichenicidin family type 2 lantibiotic
MGDQTIPQPILAGLYQRAVLDPIVEVARTIAHDLVRRPRHYRSVPENVAVILEGFRNRTGRNAEWLSATQRKNVFSSMFDVSLAECSTYMRSAVVGLAEHGIGGNPALLGPVRDAVSAFRANLKALDGRAISEADRETGPVFRNAIEVLRNEAVAFAFGLPAAPGGTWPMDGALEADETSSNGGYLIEVIQQTLEPFTTQPAMTQNRFIHLQRVAHYGAMTISAVLDDTDAWDKDERIRSLVGNAYSWEKASQALLPTVDVVRAWKDPRYRQALSMGERAMIASHPSGEVNLKDAQLDPRAARSRIESGYRRLSTQTYLEICCSTGDLDCLTQTRYYSGCNFTGIGFTCVSTGDNLTCTNCDTD